MSGRVNHPAYQEIEARLPRSHRKRYKTWVSGEEAVLRRARYVLEGFAEVTVARACAVLLKRTPHSCRQQLFRLGLTGSCGGHITTHAMQAVYTLVGVCRADPEIARRLKLLEALEPIRRQ